jgi:hypothetical protein
MQQQMGQYNMDSNFNLNQQFDPNAFQQMSGGGNQNFMFYPGNNQYPQGNNNVYPGSNNNN